MAMKKTQVEQFIDGIAGQAMRGWRDMEEFIKRLPDNCRAKVMADVEVIKVVNAMRAVGRLVAHEGMDVAEDLQ